MPSSISTIYWSNSFSDLKFKLKIRAGEASAHHSQTFEVMAKVVSNALGGSESKNPAPKKAPVQNKEEMLAAFQSVYG